MATRSNALGQFIGAQQAGFSAQKSRLGLADARRNQPIRNELADIGLARARREEQTSGRQTGITEESQRVQFLNNVGKAFLNIPEPQRQLAAQRITPLAEQVGVDPGVFTPERMTDQSLQQLVSLTEGFIRNPETLEKQKLDLRERELTQRKELAFARPELAGQTEAEKLEAQRGRKADVAGEVETAKLQAKISSKVVGDSFNSIAKINKNILNIDRAIEVLNQGAKTGAVQQFVPSITAASRELKQIQRELGLDIVGAVTFGALSKGELDLALGTALDLGQSEESLIDILTRKKEAQNKLINYYQQAISFLSQPGSTVAQFMESGQQQTQRQGGQLMIDAQGNRAMVFPDGTFEEIQ